MKLNLERGSISNIFHVVAKDSSVTTGANLTGLAFNTGSLVARKIRGGETLVTLTIEDITTLGTYAAPTSNAHIRFKEVSSTNWPGLYEVHIHNDWCNDTNYRRSLLFCFRGATNLAPIEVELQLTQKDPAVRGIVTTGATTTSIPTSALDPAVTVADQFKGRILIFDRDTTTAALRSQGGDLAGNTSGGTLSMTNLLTTAPASGDTFSIY